MRGLFGYYPEVFEYNQNSILYSQHGRWVKLHIFLINMPPKCTHGTNLFFLQLPLSKDELLSTSAVISLCKFALQIQLLKAYWVAAYGRKYGKFVKKFRRNFCLYN